MKTQNAFTNGLELPRISVMSLKPEDVLVFSTVDKLSAEVYHRVEQKIIDWKKDCNISNKHLLLTSAIELKVLRPEETEKMTPNENQIL